LVYNLFKSFIFINKELRVNILSNRWGTIIALMILLLVSLSLVSAQEESYTIQSGDTIQSIADRFDVTIDALLQYNGIIDPNRIFRGQVLNIPIGVVTPPASHLVQSGETLQWIAERYNVTQEAIIEINNITNISRLTIGQILALPETSAPTIFTTEHTVQPGQTLREIGELYGISWEELAEINNLPNPNLLQVGQTLIVPAVGSAPEPQPVVVAPAPVTAQPQPPAQLQTYVVQVGDNPSLIADRFGVTLQSLIEINNLGGNLPIFAGDVLLIPPTGGVIGGGGGGTVEATTPAFEVAPGQYVVQPNDTLFGIAARYGRNVYDIAATNGLLNLNAIYVGQVLNIQ
jgi:LysM repeat protein